MTDQQYGNVAYNDGYLEIGGIFEKDGSVYRSRFSGAEIDAGISNALHIWCQIYPSSEENPADLDLICNVSSLHIIHYINSFDDTSTNPIDLLTYQVNKTHLRQEYMYNDQRIVRFYNLSSLTWSEWMIENDILSVQSSETVVVNKPTVVLRSGGDEIHTDQSDALK